MIRSKAITRSARGEPCTVQIAGKCQGGTDTTVAAHLQFQGGIMGGKTDDHSVAFACAGCHACIDGVDQQCDEFKENRWFYMARALVRTQSRLIDKGIIEVKK